MSNDSSPFAAPGSGRKLVFAATTMLVVTLAALLLSEAASRTIRTFVCEGRGTVFHVPNPDYGLAHAPSIRGVNQGCFGRGFEFRVEVQTNSHGLVGAREVAYARSSGIPRVLALGDSVAEAGQVPRGEGFVEKIATDLGASHSGLEMVNAGTAAYSVHNQAAFYETEGVKYGADLVLSVLNLQNDVGEISPRLHARDYAAFGTFATANLSVDDAGYLVIDKRPWREAADAAFAGIADRGLVGDSLLRNFYVVRRVAHLFDAPAPPDTSGLLPTMVGQYVEPLPEEWSEAWALLEATYRTLARDAAAHGARLGVVVLPAREMVVDAKWDELARGAAAVVGPPSRLDREGPRRRVDALLVRLGIDHLDLTDALRSEIARSGRSGFFDYDLHPDAEGHRRMAAALEPWLEPRL